MARPNNSIGTIKLPGDSVARPIVPYALGYSSSNGYQATLPVLTQDDIIALCGESNTFTNSNYFQSIIGLWDSDNGDYVNFQCSSDSFNFYSNYYGTEWRLGYDEIVPYIYYEDWNGNALLYHFPETSGRLALEIDIVDLTQL